MTCAAQKLRVTMAIHVTPLTCVQALQALTVHRGKPSHIKSKAVNRRLEGRQGIGSSIGTEAVPVEGPGWLSAWLWRRCTDCSACPH